MCRHQLPDGLALLAGVVQMHVLEGNLLRLQRGYHQALAGLNALGEGGEEGCGELEKRFKLSIFLLRKIELKNKRSLTLGSVWT